MAWMRAAWRRADPRPPRIYLHVGAMKTGTTYLQHLMDMHRGSLAEAGYCFPGESWSDQHRAAREILDFDMTDPRRAEECTGAWSRLTSEMLTHQGKASVLSMEFLSYADRERAANVVDSFPGAEVHVVLTVRDAAAALPAQWQTACQGGRTHPLRGVLRGARRVLRQGEDAGGRAAGLLRRTQDVARMLDTWTAVVGADKVHVITMPGRGSPRRLLWERFAEVLELDPEVCPDVEVPANPSLGLASTELVRLLNKRIRGFDSYDRDAVVAVALCRRILAPRASSETPITLHAQGRRLAARWNRRTRQSLVRHGVHLVGDLDDLPGQADPAGAPAKLPQPTVAELLEAATAAREGLRAWLPELEAAAASLAPEVARTRVASLAQAPEAIGPPPWRDDPDPLRSALDELAGLVGTCVQLHRAATGAPTSAAGQIS
jgi:hypothetical protein